MSNKIISPTVVGLHSCPCRQPLIIVDNFSYILVSSATLIAIAASDNSTFSSPGTVLVNLHNQCSSIFNSISRKRDMDWTSQKRCCMKLESSWAINASWNLLRIYWHSTWLRYYAMGTYRAYRLIWWSDQAYQTHSDVQYNNYDNCETSYNSIVKACKRDYGRICGVQLAGMHKIWSGHPISLPLQFFPLSFPPFFPFFCAQKKWDAWRFGSRPWRLIDWATLLSDRVRPCSVSVCNVRGLHILIVD